MNRSILCFGEVLWDAFGDGKQPGGATMNVAFHLMQQGAPVCFMSSVGNDKPGSELLEFLKDNYLYNPLIQRHKNLPTCQVTVELDDKQQATYVIPQPVSWDQIHPDKKLTERAAKAAAIVFGSLICRSDVSKNTLLNLLSDTKAMKVFDVNLRHPHYDTTTIETLAAHADVVKMNEEEANLLLSRTKGDLKDKITEFHSKYHVNTICVTRGDKGAIVWHDHVFYEHEGYPVKVVDTVGAGDAFLATFVKGLLDKLPMADILKRACAVGAFVAGKRGANPRYVEGVAELMETW
ncbi:carbohydrate kinase family protein [Mucilaginibacter auburnensis]|uniref:Fructokinase n=1 Tax=Mucilaginibacter auburnensis TaxID=1457233 RepID=A0A2H9VNC6_9SPHI|nr:carbohydrate kinase [Mucilaginibacter auburnensis]PJJ79831.1 fructokinase [Mucilaginibacter auburnensis]